MTKTSRIKLFAGNNAYGVGLDDSNLIVSFTTAVLQFFVVAPEIHKVLLYEWQMELHNNIKDKEFDLFKVNLVLLIKFYLPFLFIVNLFSFQFYILIANRYGIFLICY